jgi:TonB-linked SusC/RagA family outer membrane protein
MSQSLSALAAMVLLIAPGLAAQTGTIAGRVIDAGSNLPIPAAQVFIADLDLGVLSQQNGSYLLANVPVGPRTVTVQRIGYRQLTANVTVAAGQTVVQDFRITEEALQLDEIIITGTPGGTQRRAIGNTVTSVEVTNIVQEVSITGVQDLLTGRTPGLTFSRLSGNVGQGSPLRVRGTGSFSLDTAPLVYVDGVRVNNDDDAGPAVASGAGVNVIDDFNPEDIESIEIIKGPAAASLYGTEASAGVIQIITKRGREGAPEFNVSIREGLNYVVDPAGRLGTMYTCPYDDAPGGLVGTTQLGSYPTAPAIVPSGTNNLLCDEFSELVTYNMYDEANEYIQEGYYPWQTPRLYSEGHAQSYNLEVRGGTQAINYFLSTNYDRETGFVYYNTDETFRMRGNVGVVFSEMFSLDLSTMYVDGFTRFASPVSGDGGEWQDLLWSNGYFLHDVTPFGTTGSNPRLGGFQEKLPSDIPENESTREYNRFTGSTTMRFQTGEVNLGGMAASLTQRLVLGIDKQWDINSNVFPLEDGQIPAHLQQYFPAGAKWNASYSENVTGTGVYSRPITTNLSFDYALTTNLQVNDAWSLATSAGAQYNIRETNNFSNSGTGFASPLSRTINQIAQSNISTSYSNTTNKGLGLYVQEEVAFRDRIFVTGALRFDDNSTFGVDAPAQTYPKLSGSWVISEESFWPLDFVSSLRLRGAWGKAGRQPSALAGYNVYTATPGPGGQPALRPSSPGNTGVEPEVSTELELGFEFSLLEDRISGEFTHFNRSDRQALLGIAIPGSFGFPGSVDTNVGQIDNWGWEAQLNTRLYESDLVSFDLGLTADHTDNEIKSLCSTIDGQQSCFAGSGTIAIGIPYPTQNIQWEVSDATWNATGNYQNAFAQRFTANCFQAQSLAPRDAAGQASSDSLRYGKVRGAPAPCQTLTSWTRGFVGGRSYATHSFSVAPRISLFNDQLQIFAMAQGEYGRTREDSGHNWGHIYNNSAVSRTEDDPVWVASQTLNGNSADDFTKGLFDGDFWKLREVGARYNLPEAWIAPTGASRASLAFSARNLMTIWQRQKRIYGEVITDPEYGSASLTGDGNFWETPPIASLSVTLRVTF